jgi:hypothetical protein
MYKKIAGYEKNFSLSYPANNELAMIYLTENL